MGLGVPVLHHTREIIIFRVVIYRWRGTGNAGGPGMVYSTLPRHFSPFYCF